MARKSKNFLDINSGGFSDGLRALDSNFGLGGGKRGKRGGGLGFDFLNFDPIGGKASGKNGLAGSVGIVTPFDVDAELGSTRAKKGSPLSFDFRTNLDWTPGNAFSPTASMGKRGAARSASIGSGDSAASFAGSAASFVSEKGKKYGERAGALARGFLGRVKAKISPGKGGLREGESIETKEEERARLVAEQVRKESLDDALDDVDDVEFSK